MPGHAVGECFARLVKLANGRMVRGAIAERNHSGRNHQSDDIRREVAHRGLSRFEGRKPVSAQALSATGIKFACHNFSIFGHHQDSRQEEPYMAYPRNFRRCRAVRPRNLQQLKHAICGGHLRSPLLSG